jgi:hypothetical protein
MQALVADGDSRRGAAARAHIRGAIAQELDLPADESVLEPGLRIRPARSWPPSGPR